MDDVLTDCLHIHVDAQFLGRVRDDGDGDHLRVQEFLLREF